MRIAPEAVNDRFVFEFELIVVRRSMLSIESLCLHMSLSRLTVHIWQKKKPTLRWRKRIMNASANGLLSQNQSHWILRERCRRIPVDVSRELVEHYDFCESALWLLAPRVQFSLRSLTQKMMKAIFDVFVEF